MWLISTNAYQMLKRWVMTRPQRRQASAPIIMKRPMRSNVFATALVLILLATGQPVFAQSNSLTDGQALTANQRLVSTNGQFVLTMEGTGDLVLRANGVQTWHSGTAGLFGDRLLMQGDGNLVMSAPNVDHAIWASGTDGVNATKSTLVLQDDGRLLIFRDGGRLVWSATSHANQFSAVSVAGTTLTWDDLSMKSLFSCAASVARATYVCPTAPINQSCSYDPRIPGDREAKCKSVMFDNRCYLTVVQVCTAQNTFPLVSFSTLNGYLPSRSNWSGGDKIAVRITHDKTHLHVVKFILHSELGWYKELRVRDCQGRTSTLSTEGSQTQAVFFFPADNLHCSQLEFAEAHFGVIGTPVSYNLGRLAAYISGGAEVAFTWWEG